MVGFHEAVAEAVYLLNSRGIYSGKTVIHKTLYFSLANKRFDYFGPYHYGPYSEDVQLAFQFLYEKNLIVRKESGDGFTMLDTSRAPKAKDNFSLNMETTVSFLNDKEFKKQMMWQFSQKYIFLCSKQ